jgi:GAF domain-containing protein
MHLPTGAPPIPPHQEDKAVDVADEGHFLRELLAEAPFEVVERPLRHARKRGAPAAEIARLEEATDLALHLRSILAERRRRERELSALYETAGDLIGIRDVERVLRAIIRRARRLLAADTAYLTLIDEERGDTVMRVTEGMVGEDFRRLRLPFGVGLGGLVAENARPSFTSDYINDPRFVHTGSIDSAVSLESIVAIVGVPLMVAERVIGVLFAADRTVRHFSPDEVSLLQSLGAHAAIAIENARLFQETRHALEELSAANAMVRAHSEAVERAAAIHERLTDIVLRGGDMDAVARTVAEVLDADVAVIDAERNVISSAGDATWVHGPNDGLDAALPEVQSTGRTVRIDAPDALRPPTPTAAPHRARPAGRRAWPQAPTSSARCCCAPPAD